MCFCVIVRFSDRFIKVVIVIDLHPVDQLSHQLLHGVRAQPADLQDALVVHAFRVLVTLHHLKQSELSQSLCNRVTFVACSFVNDHSYS